MYMQPVFCSIWIFYSLFFSLLISSAVLLRAASLCLCFEWFEKWGRVGEALAGMALSSFPNSFFLPSFVVVTELYSEVVYGFCERVQFAFWKCSVHLWSGFSFGILLRWFET